MPPARTLLEVCRKTVTTISAARQNAKNCAIICRKDVETAREQLAEATKALEDGREPTEEERQIVVGRDKKGKPTGVNSLIRKPEYYERIACTGRGREKGRSQSG